MKAKPGMQTLRLEPESGVQTVDGRWRAVSLPIWLRLEPSEIVTSYRWIKLRYSSGFFDEPVRPLIRFVAATGKTFVQPMNGAILGSAEWIGRVPDQTASVSISPGRRLGPFSFRIDRIDTISRLELLRRGWLNDPAWCFWAVRSRCVGSREEAWQALKYAMGGMPLERYSEWHARMARALDLEGFDRPRTDWTLTPQLHLLMALDGGEVEALQTTLNSLQGQVFQRWCLHAAVNDRTSADILTKFRENMGQDKRLFELAKNDLAPSTFADNDRLAVIEMGDVLKDFATAAVAEKLAEDPNLAVLYSDEDAIGPSGKQHSPILKPDWSPAFYDAVPYLGRLTCVRHADLVSCGAGAAKFLSDEKAVLDHVLARLDRKAVGHIRRTLYRRRSEKPVAFLRSIEKSADSNWPDVTIVIPTRDRADLLETCTTGLKEMTDYPSFDVVIVDNGSTHAEALSLLARLRLEPRFSVLEHPGPFNYSQLANDGARCTDAPMLVFLNNDIQMLDPGWLKAMVEWAMKPDIGVVGAKLLFPNGKIQHAGVVVGMGGIAGHVYRRCRVSEPGYLDQMKAAREMTAVTAACIALERKKFEAVGGFDAHNLPIDLNDMDLCLRVAEGGWTNIWTPNAVMIHVQSASRGIDRDPFEQYRQERSYFTGRWTEAIRDDPYFHPGLSLFNQRPVLGV